MTLFPSRTWTDGKTKDIINCLYIYIERWSSRLGKGPLHLRRVLAVFGQSQGTVPVGQSEQTALIGKMDFVEKTTIMYNIWKVKCFWTLKHVNIFCYTKYTKKILKKASYDPFKSNGGTGRGAFCPWAIVGVLVCILSRLVLGSQ